MTEPTTQADAQLVALREALDRLGRTNHEIRRHGSPFETCTWQLCEIARLALSDTAAAGEAAVARIRDSWPQGPEAERALAGALFAALGWPTRQTEFGVMSFPDGLVSGDPDNPEWGKATRALLVALGREP